MPPRHSVSTEVNVTMPKRTAEQRHNANGHLQAGDNQGGVARHMGGGGGGRATINRLWVRYDHTGSARDRPRSGRPRATVPAQDWYIRLMHLA